MSYVVPSGIHATITGPVVMIGMGSIGRATLPLLDRHIDFDRSRAIALDPLAERKKYADEFGIAFKQIELTPENYVEVLTPLLTNGDGQGFCINLSVDTSSVDIMRLCRDLGALYIDTVIEPWPGLYYNETIDNADRTNQFLRSQALAERRRAPGGVTAVSCCGANPGMVSWFVKEALVKLSDDLNLNQEMPAANDRDGWSRYMQNVGVKGIHIAERDTQRVTTPKPHGTFWNTWSVDGFLSEGLQPAELGWGTHEKWMPPTARQFSDPNSPAIFLETPGADTRVRTWCPTLGEQYGFLVTHNEALSIPDFYSVRDDSGKVVYRPTCHYAYHPCNDAVLSFHELFGAGGQVQEIKHVLDEDQIVDGIDELGVLVYGHAKNALWFGSRLSIEEARALAPYNTATGLQISSAVLAGVVWALENPNEGIVETDEMDHVRCLEIQVPYLGPVEGHYTDWNPLSRRLGLFPDDIDASDPWQFRNILVH